MKRYPEPMGHGPEACEPSHPLWPMARRPVSRLTPVPNPLTPAVSGISLFSNPQNL